jgi:hypothetical protein
MSFSEHAIFCAAAPTGSELLARILGDFFLFAGFHAEAGTSPG